MKKTANYALNQWDPADRILRTDFNDDNAKLDAAIMAVRAAVPVEKLLDVTIQTAAIQVDLDLSGIDLSPYSQLLAELIPSADTASQTHCYLRCNGVSTGYIRSADTASALASFSLGLSPDAFMGAAWGARPITVTGPTPMTRSIARAAAAPPVSGPSTARTCKC